MGGGEMPECDLLFRTGHLQLWSRISKGTSFTQIFGDDRWNLNQQRWADQSNYQVQMKILNAWMIYSWFLLIASIIIRKRTHNWLQFNYINPQSCWLKSLWFSLLIDSTFVVSSFIPYFEALTHCKLWAGTKINPKRLNDLKVQTKLCLPFKPARISDSIKCPNQ